jgi:two-component system, OmpR family, alkaline phosphatase synthesis response regulator PhoP
MRILLVEDEENLMEVIRFNLVAEGYDVTIATNGQDGLNLLRTKKFDLAILDVMLPKIDGFTICRSIREEGNRTPVLFLTAKSTGLDRITGLKIGGDDYLTKPFNLEELILRVQRLLDRTVAEKPEQPGITEYTFGGNRVNFVTYEIESVNMGKKQLTKKECMLLKLLIEKKGEVVSRDTILETVWGEDMYPSARTIDNFVLSFRKYFEPESRNPRYFHSIRGVGYKFLA